MFKRLQDTNILLTVFVALVVGGMIEGYDRFGKVSDTGLRRKVLKVHGDLGSCSGEQIIAPSGHAYILTAGHCLDLKGNKNSITVTTEDGRSLERAIIAEDLNSDLLLLEGVPGLAGLQIADEVHPTQRIRTFTHGAGYPTYKTEGVVVGHKTAQILLGIIGMDYSGTCNGAKYRKIEFESEYGVRKACILEVAEMISTAMIVPGSSGGMVVDDSGELVGVVSATDHSFSYMVTLKDIKAFLKGY